MGKQPTEPEPWRESEGFIKSLHEEMQKNPQWRTAASKFKRVADLVSMEIDNDDKDTRRLAEKPIRIDDVYVYLMSVAIEDLLKGILSANAEPFDEVVRFDHELVELYNKCCRRGLDSKKDERELLDILKHSAYWAGKYNVPKKEETLLTAFKVHGLHFEPGSLSVPLPGTNGTQEGRKRAKSEREKINALYERLYAYLIKVSGFSEA